MLSKEAQLNSFIKVNKIRLDVLLWQDNTYSLFIFVNDSLVHKKFGGDHWAVGSLRNKPWLIEADSILTDKGFKEARNYPLLNSGLWLSYCRDKNIEYSCSEAYSTEGW